MGKESRQSNTITVEELQEIAPLSSTYALNKYDRYLVVIQKPKIGSAEKNPYELAYERAKAVAALLRKIEVKHVIMIGNPDDLKFLEFKEEK